MLADDKPSKIFVAGVVLIDSPYHIPWSKLSLSISEPDFDGIPDLVRKSIDNCDKLLNTWELPPWDGPACEGKEVRFTVSGRSFSLQAGHVLYKPLQGEWRAMESRMFQHTETSQQPISPPPAIMVRCVQRAPTRDMSSNPCRIDLLRDEPMLGWDGNHPDFIKAVIEVDADHFNIFHLATVRLSFPPVPSLSTQPC